jgi:hypothetical protein
MQRNSAMVDEQPLPVLESRSQLSLADVLELPRQEITNGWNGETLPARARWVVALDPARLWFLGEFPVAPPLPKHARGQFVEWLAEADDVIELFIKGSDGAYQEWHISPDGAWWSMLFTGYRTRCVAPRVPEGVTVDVTRGAAHWLGVLSAPRSGLEVALDGRSMMQVSGCIFSQGPVSFFTTAGQPLYEPDFHDPRSFRAVAVCPR